MAAVSCVAVGQLDLCVLQTYMLAGDYKTVMAKESTSRIFQHGSGEQLGCQTTRICVTKHACRWRV
jgi:hypothetical protein